MEQFESPMTIRSIINWKDAAKDGTMLLRDIVDLEATYDMSDISDSKLDDTLKLIESGGDDKKDDKKIKIMKIVRKTMKKISNRMMTMMTAQMFHWPRWKKNLTKSIKRF